MKVVSGDLIDVLMTGLEVILTWCHKAVWAALVLLAIVMLLVSFPVSIPVALVAYIVGKRKRREPTTSNE
jgi:membrane protein implicated in regulation of membrane protease activity